MKLFYSIRELAKIIGEDIYSTANILKPLGVTPTHNGKPANLSKWTGGITQKGDCVWVIRGYYDDPDPNKVLVISEHLPPPWIKIIQEYEAETNDLVAEEVEVEKTKIPAKSELRGLPKYEILAVDWPIPIGHPSLKNILDKSPIPKWIDAACIKVGRAGKGPSGSHLWNPAMVAVCLASTTQGKQWFSNKQALSQLIANHFPDYREEWEEKREML